MKVSAEDVRLPEESKVKKLKDDPEYKYHIICLDTPELGIKFDRRGNKQDLWLINDTDWDSTKLKGVSSHVCNLP